MARSLPSVATPTRVGSTRSARWGRRWQGLVGVMSVAGAMHFVQPKFFEKIMPRVLGLDEHSRLLVYASGVAELTCAGLLAMPRTRRIGGWATAGLLVAVFPANIQNALDDGGLFWARLPLQAPLVVWAADIARTNAHRMKTAELARPGPPE